MSALYGKMTQVVASALVLAGCVLNDPYVGTGPIELSTSAEQAFADYRSLAYPRYFAVAEDGSAYYYSFCPEGRCSRTLKTQVVRQCETFSAGIPCKIYASSGRIVWSSSDQTSIVQ